MLAHMVNDIGISDTAHDAAGHMADRNGTDGTSKPQVQAHAHAHAHTQVMPLDSSLRTEPIHPLIMEVKLSPANIPNAPLSTLNPITLRPFTIDELRAHKLESLLSQYPTPEAAAKARDDTATELRKLLDENERKNKEIDHELEEKEKTREIERKVFARRSGKDV